MIYLSKIKEEIEELNTYVYIDEKGNVLENRCDYDEVLQIINKYIEKQEDWHDSEEPPKENEYTLLSFSNFSIPLVGRYEGGAYYIGDDLTTALSQDIYVNGWMELPKCKED